MSEKSLLEFYTFFETHTILPEDQSLYYKYCQEQFAVCHLLADKLIDNIVSYSHKDKNFIGAYKVFNPHGSDFPVYGIYDDTRKLVYLYYPMSGSIGIFKENGESLKNSVQEVMKKPVFCSFIESAIRTCVDLEFTHANYKSIPQNVVQAIMEKNNFLYVPTHEDKAKMIRQITFHHCSTDSDRRFYDEKRCEMESYYELEGEDRE